MSIGGQIFAILDFIICLNSEAMPRSREVKDALASGSHLCLENNLVVNNVQDSINIRSRHAEHGGLYSPCCFRLWLAEYFGSGRVISHLTVKQQIPPQARNNSDILGKKFGQDVISCLGYQSRCKLDSKD